MNHSTPSPDPHKALQRVADDLRAQQAPSGTDPRGTEGLPALAELAPLFEELDFETTIGRGGMGVVYRARDLRSDRQVAIKVLPPHLQQDPTFAERFEREGRVLAQLDHPNVLRVFEFGERGGFFYLMAEFVDGLDLRQLIGLGRVSTEEVLQIVPQVCAGLAYAHGQGIVHRDIKPENILVDQEGHVTIVDFGLAKIVGHGTEPITLTSATQAVGTPHYMAPEQLQNPTDVDHRADLFSLGVVFYELLTGRLPMGRFEAPSRRAPMDAAVAPKVDRVVMKSLAEAPGDRYQSADELHHDLEAQGRAGAPSAPRNRSRRRSVHRSTKGSSRALRPGILGIAGLALLVATSVLQEATGGFGVIVAMGQLLSLSAIGACCILGIMEVTRIARGQLNIRRAYPATVCAFAPLLFLAEICLIALSGPLDGGDLLLALAGMVIVNLMLIRFLAEWLRGAAVNHEVDSRGGH